jgi:ferredoxin
METDLAVMEDLAMDDSDKKWLQKQASLPGLYCQQCGQCMKQCIAKIPIPDLMRAYMYAYGYRNLKMTRDLVVSLGLPRKICDDCGSCPVKCAIGFNVPAKIRDVVRVRDIPAEFLL